MWPRRELALTQHTLSPSPKHSVVATRQLGDEKGEDVLWVWGRKLFTDVMFEVWDEEEIIVDESDDAARLGWGCNVGELTFLRYCSRLSKNF